MQVKVPKVKGAKMEIPRTSMVCSLLYCFNLLQGGPGGIGGNGGDGGDGGRGGDGGDAGDGGNGADIQVSR